MLLACTQTDDLKNKLQEVYSLFGGNGGNWSSKFKRNWLIFLFVWLISHSLKIFFKLTISSTNDFLDGAMVGNLARNRVGKNFISIRLSFPKKRVSSVCDKKVRFKSYCYPSWEAFFSREAFLKLYLATWSEGGTFLSKAIVSVVEHTVFSKTLTRLLSFAQQSEAHHENGHFWISIIFWVGVRFQVYGKSNKDWGVYLNSTKITSTLIREALFFCDSNDHDLVSASTCALVFSPTKIKLNWFWVFLGTETHKKVNFKICPKQKFRATVFFLVSNTNLKMIKQIFCSWRKID